MTSAPSCSLTLFAEAFLEAIQIRNCEDNQRRAKAVSRVRKSPNFNVVVSM